MQKWSWSLNRIDQATFWRRFPYFYMSAFIKQRIMSNVTTKALLWQIESHWAFHEVALILLKYIGYTLSVYFLRHVITENSFPQYNINWLFWINLCNYFLLSNYDRFQEQWRIIILFWMFKLFQKVYTIDNIWMPH